MQNQMDQAAMMLLAKYKAETEKLIAGIREKHNAEMEELAVKHKNDLDKLEEESQNRIAEDALKVRSVKAAG